MSYTALYRKYRPASFDDVKGQDAVVTTLRNQIRSGRIAHAYLFTGTRGTGKTSVAKIFARAVNCENPDNGNPCGVCSICRGIADGTLMNVREIDAASNNGVDDVRMIREEVAYSPTQGRYKVYIIDEVHMLSAAAFNALLKTLEEPPAYVIFILATTEAHRIPVTILSRCQRYDFRRISEEEICARLTSLLELEGVEASEKAVRYIARKADGGMRDALSLADQCISFYLGEKLEYEKVLRILGAVDTQQLGQMLRFVLKGDVAGALGLLEDMLYRGKDLGAFVSDYTGYLRDLLVIRSCGDPEGIIDASAEALAAMREEAQLISDQALIRDIRIFSALSSQLRTTVNKRISVEVALIRMCRPQMDTDEESLTERIRMLEQMAENGVFASGRKAADSARINSAAMDEAGVQTPVYQKAAPAQLQEIRQQWNLIRSQVDDQLVRSAADPKFSTLKFDASGENEDVLYVISSDVTAGDTEIVTRGQLALEDAIEAQTGSRIRVKIIQQETEASFGGSLQNIDIRKLAQEQIHFPIEDEGE